MPARPRILFIAAFEAPFILDDLRFLESRYDVVPMIGSGPVQAGRISARVASVDIIFGWFASVYAAIAVLAGASLGKRTILQIGGVDLASEPDLGYGIWTSAWKSRMVGQALRSATRVLAVDESLLDEAKMRARYDGLNIEVLPTGFDPEKWKPGMEKERRVVCVASVPDEARIQIKGLDVLVAAARKLPEVRFSVIGVYGTMVASLQAPTNLELLPWTSQEGVRAHLERAAVYCQPSRREGLPNALCEAMLCECIPVATAVGGNPRAVGNIGLLVESGDAEALARAIAMALEMPRSTGHAARQHIVDRFGRDRRERRLVQLIEGRRDPVA
jgi:glycosyltransferase involved in cell wall biosynthesis